MKKLLILSVLFFAATNSNAQEKESSNSENVQRQNDIMIDPLMLIAAPIANISYERLLNKDSGVGINALLGLGRDVENFSQVSPFYRMYFGKKYASGFFIEGFVPVTSSTTTTTYYYGNYVANPQDVKATTVGIGVGFGGKWVAKKNIVFEASMGIARRLGSNEKLDSPVTGKGMLGIGYRF